MSPLALRRRARFVVNHEIERGRLKRQPCEACGQKNNQPSVINAHHDDYRRPLNIRWLCPSCHRQHHLKHGPAAPRPDSPR